MVYNAWEHNGWGNNIQMLDWDKRDIAGHLTPRPVVGDEMRFKMESGEIGRTKISQIEYMFDPSDMFFAKLKDIGYLETAT